MYMVGPAMWRIAFRIFCGFCGLPDFVRCDQHIDDRLDRRIDAVAEDGVLTDWFRSHIPSLAPVIAS